ncbi:MAG: LysR family transcriptional regulator [Methyloligella sp.]|nr:MAG: LysR family transcriptional regulator [Methyloligella sp.]
MDIKMAKTFLAVIETGNFVNAAEKLNTTQSTISARIKTLEELIGKQLIDRSKSGSKLTPAGEQFQKHAIAMVRIWQRAQLEVALSDDHADHLAVGAQVSLWEGFLLQWLAWLRKEHSELAITANFGASAVLLDRISEGTLDLAIVYRPHQRPGFIIEHLFDEELVLVTNGDANGKGPDQDYIFVNWGPEFQSDHTEAYPGLVYMGLHLDLGSIGINYLLDNKASGYFPLRIAKPYIASDELKVMKKAPKFVYAVYAVYPEQRDEEAYEPILDSLRKFASKV